MPTQSNAEGLALAGVGPLPGAPLAGHGHSAAGSKRCRWAGVACGLTVDSAPAFVEDWQDP